MLVIRLTRKGKKNQPFFRVVVTDKRRSSKGGRAVEDLGYVDPLTKKKSLKKERALYWISKGAQPSATVNNLFVSEKIIEGKKIHVSKIKKSKLAEMQKAKDEAAAKAAPAAAAPVPAEPEKPASALGSPSATEGSGEAKPADESKPAEETK